MASEEVKKKWGTIFMGDREASVEQLSAMQESLQREQRKKEQTEDYMERVRARAADRAREILGAAYAERQKVLDEARQEAQEQKKRILGECDKLKAEAENAARKAKAELEKAEAERKEAENLRDNAHEEGFASGMEQSRGELHEFRLELGQALGRLLRALEWQQNEILKNWRDDLVALVQCAAQAGSGFVLSREHKEIMRSLVFQALDLLESRRSISIRVNPEDESQVADLFRAARERYPELGQWIVTGDEKIEKGGLVAESGSGSVDLKRENFREMIDGILSHLALPDGEDKTRYEEIIREIVEREASRITSLTPELDIPEKEIAKEPIEPEIVEEEVIPVQEESPAIDVEVLAEEAPFEPEEASQSEQMIPETYQMDPLEEEIFEDVARQETPIVEEPPLVEESAVDPALAALEEELFPLDEEPVDAKIAEVKVNQSPGEPEPKELDLKPETLAQGGFL